VFATEAGFVKLAAKGVLASGVLISCPCAIKTDDTQQNRIMSIFMTYKFDSSKKLKSV
jgi:hypothetical protein